MTRNKLSLLALLAATAALSGSAMAHPNASPIPMKQADKAQTACLFCCKNSCNGVASSETSPRPVTVAERWTGFQGRNRIN